MKNKIIILIFTISLAFPSIVNGEYTINRNYLKLTDSNSKDTESIEIKNTEITDKNKANELLGEINKRDKYSQIKNAGTVKFKGGAEEIYNEYADSVVLIGNRKKCILSKTRQVVLFPPLGISKVPSHPLLLGPF